MTITSSGDGTTVAGAPKDVQRGAAALDDVDRAILRILAADARIPNNALAAAVGVAPSTCLARVRSLRERRVIRGFHADVDPAALGHDLQAMVAVGLQAHARAHLREMVTRLAALPEVLDVYFVAGVDDFLVHVATPGTDALRRFVAERLNTDPDVARTQTSLIFEHTRAAGHPTA